MRETEYLWLKDNLHVFQNVKLTIDERQQMFDIYNRLSGQKMKPTSCGRCVSNVKKRLLVEYDRYEIIQGY